MASTSTNLSVNSADTPKEVEINKKILLYL